MTPAVIARVREALTIAAPLATELGESMLAVEIARMLLEESRLDGAACDAEEDRGITFGPTPPPKPIRKPGRPATGSVSWRRNPRTGAGQWFARITAPDGRRPWVELDPSIAEADRDSAVECAALVVDGIAK